MRQIFANLLALPFIAGGLVFLYLAWTKDIDFAPLIIPFVLGATLVFLFSPQINWWWYNRRPPELPVELSNMLERFCGFYRRLDTAGKQRFCERVALFRMGTDWTPMGWPDEVLPPDVELAIAAQAVMLNFSKKQLLVEKFEKVIVYPQPFPSPEYTFAHASELYEPDGCLLFSAEQVMKAFLEPAKWYNVALHEYAKAFVLTYPTGLYPDLSVEDIWERLATASGMSRDHVEAVIGLAGVDALPVAIHHYFIFPDRFREVFPKEADFFDRIFT